MAIIPSPPDSVWECPLLGVLRDKSTHDNAVAEKVKIFIQTANPMVDLIIAGPFKEYTLHNRDHSKKLLHLMGHLISAETLFNLSPLEHLVIVYSAYLHDMGMCLTDTERQRILVSEDFLNSFQEWQELWDNLLALRKGMATADEKNRFIFEAKIFQLQEAALAAYLRPRHATEERYHNLINVLKTQSNRHDLFEYRGVSFEDYLIDICVSHNLDASVLAEVTGPHRERFPRKVAVGGAYLNTQLCAALLRLADVLDFDRERTPRILFESLDILDRALPGSDLTIREWQKHMAVHTIELNKDEIVISSDSQHPVIEKAIRDFCQIIEREIRDTLAVLKQNMSEILERYNVDLPLTVRAQVRASGYVFKDISLTLNQARITSLLMGERLYTNSIVAVRELLQNALDACFARSELEESTYHPDIRLSVVEDKFGLWVEVTDNGLGMDEHVLSEFFLRLGNSYYSSPEFGRIMRGVAPKNQFTPISRFGIGIISVFIIGDILEVYTKAAHSPRGDSTNRCLRIEKLGALAFVTESDSGTYGTRIRVRLRRKFSESREQFFQAVSQYLRITVVRPRWAIKVDLLGTSFVLQYRVDVNLRPNAREMLEAKNIECVMLDIARWSDRFSGTVIILFAKTDDGKLSHLQEGRYLRLGTTGIDPHTFLMGFSGNRITVNGFSMNLKNASKVFAVGKNRLPMLLDLDIQGDEEVQYDISRERITGAGRTIVREALEKAIFSGLTDTGIVERLAPETRRLLDLDFRQQAWEKGALAALREGRGEALRPNEPMEILDEVEKLLPKHVWPLGLHKAIASKLKISNGLAYRAITTLIRRGRVKPPE